MSHLLLWAIRSAFAAALSLVTVFALVPGEELPTALMLWDKGNHFVAFFTLALLLDYSFPYVRGILHHAKWIVLVAYGVGIECLQWYVGYRAFEVTDMVADAIGLATWAVLAPFVDLSPRLAALRCMRPEN